MQQPKIIGSEVDGQREEEEVPRGDSVNVWEDVPKSPVHPPRCARSRDYRRAGSSSAEGLG